MEADAQLNRAKARPPIAPKSTVSRLTIGMVCPVLDEAESIEEFLAHARASGVDKITVVDGGSRDATPDIVRRLGLNVVSIASANRGAQMNAGAAATKTDVLLFLHADCHLPSEAIEQIHDRVQPEQPIAGAFRQRIDSPKLRYRILEAGNTLRTRIVGWAYGDQAIFIDKNTFNRIGGFPTIPLMEDLAFSKTLRDVEKVQLLKGPVHVSARRWQKQGVVFCTLRNWTFVALFHLGVSPSRLARWYGKIR